MQNVYIGSDIGTSSVKTVVYDENFKQIYKLSKKYNLISNKKNQAELNPDEVFEAVLQTLKTVIQDSKNNNHKIEFISFSSALHSLILLDENHQLLTNCLTWADTRAKNTCNKLKRFYQDKNIYSRTGCPLHSLYLSAKILWFKNNFKEIFNQADKFISIKEYIIYKLTGVFAVDYSIASGSGLLNINYKEWDKKLLNYLGIDEAQLSSLVNSYKTYKAKNIDWLKDIPLVIGGGDGPLANLGELALSENQFVATLGTSGAIRVFSDKPVIDYDNQRTWCYMLDKNTYLPGGAINNGGIVLEWLRKNFFESTDNYYELIDQYIKEIPPGGKNLFFLPFITGERSPNWNPNARGIVFGLDYYHSKKELIKAAVEGITFRLKTIKEALEVKSNICNEVILNGGVTQSEPWIQLIADILNARVIVNENEEAAALGAVMIGSISLGFYDDYNSIDFKHESGFVKEPDQELVEKYYQLYLFHKEIYDNNKKLFSKIT
ncbi:MAG: gluconokinase [Nanoarchaeota archaeon]